jgi:hypothetical protein
VCCACAQIKSEKCRLRHSRWDENEHCIKKKEESTVREEGALSFLDAGRSKRGAVKLVEEVERTEAVFFFFVWVCGCAYRGAARECNVAETTPMNRGRRRA